MNSRTHLVLSSVLLLSALPSVAAAPASGVPRGCDPAVMGDAYWATWNAAEQRRIDADIELNRKADGVFAVPDADGTEVAVEQLTHDFRFGAHGFFLGTFATDELNRRYEENFCRLFNQVTIPFYWRTFEPHPGHLAFHERTIASGLTTDQLIDFAKFRGMRIHGHPLCWGDEQYMLPFWLYQQFCPDSEKLFLRFPAKESRNLKYEHCGADWDAAYQKRFAELFRNYTDAEIAARCPVFLANQRRHTFRRIGEIIDYCGDRVDSWDVVNESSKDWVKSGRTCENNAPFTRSTYGICPANYALEAFREAARHASAHPRLAINDWNIEGEEYPAQVADLAAHGARIDLVGAQFHLFQDADLLNLVEGGDYRGAATPAGIRALFARLGAGGRPVHLSEITVPAPGCNARGRQQQAIAVRNFYRAWFSQPSAWGITWWHTADWWREGQCGERPEGGCENGSAGVLDADCNPKPAFRALDELINGEWKTRLTAKVAGGEVAFRGFRGSYRLAWTCGKCGRRHERLVELLGEGGRERGHALAPLDCEVPVREFAVDGRAVTLAPGEERIDLTKLYPGEVVRGKVGERWATVELTLVAPADGEYVVNVFNDWFGEYAINGGQSVKSNGPSDFTRAVTLTLRKGDNRITYRTRAGSSGRWLFGLYLKDGCGLTATRVGL